ncbi:MAG: putative thiamine biosynthesis protein [Clostridiales bacterium]|jgi:thiamine biosynthesis lipoprotein|nr:putative thiamine biosynthesis protein [Clostridiales bacterium]
MKSIFALKPSRILLIFLPTILLFSSCNKNNLSEPVSKTEFVLGTVCTITLYDKAPDQAFEESFKKLKEIEDKMTINAPGSEVDAVNNASGVEYIKLSDETFYVIKEGKNYSELSGGIFDISVGPMVKLWNIGTDSARVPTQEEIDGKLPLIGYKNILLNEKEKSVMLKDKAMLIDLGGVAKGYAADEVKKILKDNGVKSAIINLGGNVLTIGENTQGRPWRVGIQNPDATRGDYVGTVQVTDQTIVTSGIYERYFVADSKHYHHMLNPFDGYPFENNLASVTIITDVSMVADAFSTSVFGKGLDEGMQYVSEQKNMEAIFVTRDNQVYITPGLKDNFKIANADFKLMN